MLFVYVHTIEYQQTENVIGRCSCWLRSSETANDPSLGLQHDGEDRRDGGSP